MRAMSAENVKKVFQVLDVDGSGFIEEEELKWVKLLSSHCESFQVFQQHRQ